MGLRAAFAKVRYLATQRSRDGQMSRTLRGVNAYWRQLSAEEIATGEHRQFVGGLWEEIGNLQLQFLLRHGLRPHHKLINLGCGALRGGVQFVRFLEPGNYYGLDINASLIRAGMEELKLEGIADKRPNLMINDKFEMSKFGTLFDYGIVVSVFTHLHINYIVRCLAEMRKVMMSTSKFYITYFEALSPRHFVSMTHYPGNIITNFDSDPFHYAFQEIHSLARQAGLTAQAIGAWGHPRAQSMVCLTVSETSKEYEGSAV